MQEETAYKQIIAYKYSFFKEAMLLFGILASIVLTTQFAYLYYCYDANEEIDIPIAPFIIAGIFLLIPFIILLIEKRKPKNIITYDRMNEIFEVYAYVNEKKDLVKISVEDIADVDVYVRYVSRRCHDLEDYDNGGRIIFKLNNGVQIESLMIKKPSENWKIVEKIVLRNNQ